MTIVNDMAAVLEYSEQHNLDLGPFAHLTVDLANLPVGTDRIDGHLDPDNCKRYDTGNAPGRFKRRTSLEVCRGCVPDEDDANAWQELLSLVHKCTYAHLEDDQIVAASRVRRSSLIPLLQSYAVFGAGMTNPRAVPPALEAAFSDASPRVRSAFAKVSAGTQAAQDITLRRYANKLGTRSAHAIWGLGDEDDRPAWVLADGLLGRGGNTHRTGRTLSATWLPTVLALTEGKTIAEAHGRHIIEVSTSVAALVVSIPDVSAVPTVADASTADLAAALRVYDPANDQVDFPDCVAAIQDA